MKKEIYICDNCQKEIGDKKHLSIHFNNHSGWVEPDNWKHLTNVSGIKQFCDEKCLADYLSEDTDNSIMHKTIEELIDNEQSETPTFKVGDRVECIERDGFTKEMVYKIIGKGQYLPSFVLIRDDGNAVSIIKEDFHKHFKPYEKPEVGDDYWIVNCAADDCVDKGFWRNDDFDNNAWNLGLAFKTKEQAEFGRERLSKLF